MTAEDKFYGAVVLHGAGMSLCLGILARPQTTVPIAIAMAAGFGMGLAALVNVILKRLEK